VGLGGETAPGGDGGGRGGPLDGPALAEGVSPPASDGLNGDFETWNLGSPGEDGFTGCPPLGVIFREGLLGSGASAIKIMFLECFCELSQTVPPWTHPRDFSLCVIDLRKFCTMFQSYYHACFQNHPESKICRPASYACDHQCNPNLLLTDGTRLLGQRWALNYCLIDS